MIHRILTALCLILCIVSCTTDDNDTDTKVNSSNEDLTSTQTTLIYFAGTSLKSAFNNNISDIKSAVAAGDLGSNGRIFYYMGTYSGTAALYEIYQDGNSSVVETVKSYSDISWSSSSTLTQIINDTKEAVEFSSTSTINLILSGHGTGWVLQEHPYLTAGEVTSTSIWDPATGALPTRFMGSKSDGYMDIVDLCDGIEESDTKFGYILFDACLMSSVEALYRMRNYSDYIIASPAEVMSYGFPYQNIIQYMFENDGLSYNVEKICEEYIYFYSTYAYPYGTIAACVTSELDGLANAIKNLGFKTLDKDEISSLQSYEGLTDHVLYDLEDYVETAADGDLTQFNEALERAFPSQYRFHTSKFYTGLGSYGSKEINSYSGVSTSAPSSMFRDDWYAEPWTIITGQN